MPDPVELHHCHECGAGVLPGIDHDTYDEKDGVRWWCPEHCPQCLETSGGD